MAEHSHVTCCRDFVYRDTSTVQGLDITVDEHIRRLTAYWDELVAIHELSQTIIVRASSVAPTLVDPQYPHPVNTL